MKRRERVILSVRRVIPSVSEGSGRVCGAINDIGHRASLALVLALLVSCSSFHLVEVQEVDRMYFGTATPTGVVSDAEWKSFVDEVVTPRFPGFTEWNAVGHWQNEREESHVIEVVHPQSGEADRKVAEIIAAYKSRFHQQAVFWTRSRALAEAR